MDILYYFVEIKMIVTEAKILKYKTDISSVCMTICKAREAYYKQKL